MTVTVTITIAAAADAAAAAAAIGRSERRRKRRKRKAGERPETDGTTRPWQKTRPAARPFGRCGHRRRGGNALSAGPLAAARGRRDRAVRRGRRARKLRAAARAFRRRCGALCVCTARGAVAGGPGLRLSFAPRSFLENPGLESTALSLRVPSFRRDPKGGLVTGKFSNL